MPWIPEEEIKRAREITAIEYLKKYQPIRQYITTEIIK